MDKVLLCPSQIVAGDAIAALIDGGAVTVAVTAVRTLSQPSETTRSKKELYCVVEVAKSENVAEPTIEKFPLGLLNG